MKKIFIAVSTFLIAPLVVSAAATMQNDTESIALPSTITGGQSQVIFDNPDLIQDWVASGNPTTDYYSSLGTAFLVSTDGTASVVIGDPSSDAGASLLEYLGADNGITFNSSPSVSTVVRTGAPAFGGIFIQGSKLREALAKKGILTVLVSGWDFDDTYYLDDSEYYASLASIDTSDLAVIAATVVFRNQNIESVSIDGSTIGITYRTKGWLLWFIPIRFTVSLSINASGTTDSERVRLSYPWYRLITWLPVSPNELAANLNAAIIGIQAAGLSTETTQARLFTYVGSLLKLQEASDVSGLPAQPTTQQP
jgi:hypothetical protein